VHVDQLATLLAFERTLGLNICISYRFQRILFIRVFYSPCW